MLPLRAFWNLSLADCGSFLDHCPSIMLLAIPTATFCIYLKARIHLVILAILHSTE
jgi:hypothetical protein